MCVITVCVYALNGIIRQLINANFFFARIVAKRLGG